MLRTPFLIDGPTPAIARRIHATYLARRRSVLCLPTTLGTSRPCSATGRSTPAPISPRRRSVSCHRAACRARADWPNHASSMRLSQPRQHGSATGQPTATDQVVSALPASTDQIVSDLVPPTNRVLPVLGASHRSTADMPYLHWSHLGVAGPCDLPALALSIPCGACPSTRRVFADLVDPGPILPRRRSEPLRLMPRPRMPYRPSSPWPVCPVHVVAPRRSPTHPNHGTSAHGVPTYLCLANRSCPSPTTIRTRTLPNFSVPTYLCLPRPSWIRPAMPTNPAFACPFLLGPMRDRRSDPWPALPTRACPRPVCATNRVDPRQCTPRRIRSHPTKTTIRAGPNLAMAARLSSSSRTLPDHLDYPCQNKSSQCSMTSPASARHPSSSRLPDPNRLRPNLCRTLRPRRIRTVLALPLPCDKPCLSFSDLVSSVPCAATSRIRPHRCRSLRRTKPDLH